MKKSGRYGIAILAFVLLAQPIGFYLHTLDHGFEGNDSTQTTISLESDAFCGLCYTYLNQHADITPQFIHAPASADCLHKTEMAADFIRPLQWNTSPRGPPVV